ncbi:MAG: right-handed parallel beta-helix repeat-containing protein, partial [Chloroflexi bacterium]
MDAGAPYNHPILFTLTANANGTQATIPVTVTTQNGIEYVGGIISSDTVWTGDKTYIVTSNILVNQGVTLTIQPGAVISYENNYYIRAKGILKAIGNHQLPIVLTGPGAAIVELDCPAIVRDGQYVDGCTIQYASLKGVGIKGTSVYIAYNKISDVHSYGYNSAAPLIISGDSIAEYNEIVDNQTSYFGTLAADGGVVRHNTVKYNVGGYSGGIYATGETTVSYNIVRGNRNGECGALPPRGSGTGAGGILADGAITISHNLIEHNYGAPVGGIVILSSNSTVYANTIVWNGKLFPNCGQSGGVGSTVGGFRFEQNNLFGNDIYDFYNASTQDILAHQNWWASTNPSVVAENIYDFADDIGLGSVQFEPLLFAPSSLAPAFLYQVSISPPSPLSTGYANVILDFSAPMSPTIQPTVTFGVSPTYDTHIVAGDWISPTRWAGSYNVNYYTGDGVQRLRVAGAVGANDGMEIPEDTR